jgi:hypothetical protein
MLKIQSRSLGLWGILLLGLLLAVEGGRRKQKEGRVDINSEEDVPEVYFLVELIGKEIYSIVDRPKYKFYIYMTIGHLPEECGFCVTEWCSSIPSASLPASELSRRLKIQKWRLLSVERSNHLPKVPSSAWS